MELGSYYCIPDVFTKQECRSIVNTFSSKCLAHATMLKGKNKEIRTSDVYFIEPTPENDWIYKRIMGIIHKLNYEKYCFFIDQEHLQLLQFTRYKEGEYYKWHTDTGSSPDTCCRKLSVSVQLSPETAYEGGDLQFGLLDEEAGTVSKQQGSLIIFPSIIRHRVTPVTRGVRYSLVGWAVGPPFK
jgi:PKHD-type hydroxylase